MKRAITIVVVLLVAIGLGYYLFTISPEQGGATNPGLSDFDTNRTVDIKAPRQIGTDDYVLGNPAAKNVAIVYEDFQCPYCSAFAPIVEQLPGILADTKVVFRHYPLPQHGNAVPAAYAAEAAGKQGKFWEMYKALYTAQADWSNMADPAEKFSQLAQQAGISDLNKFKADMQAKVAKDKIQADLTEANSLRIGGTPTLIFNGKTLQLGNMDAGILGRIKAQAEPLYVK